MKIPVCCEKCGKLIATFDTHEDSDASFLEAPCGEKVCEDCCDACANVIRATGDFCEVRKENYGYF